MRRVTDFLVIGTGIAGLSYALKVAEHGKVVLVTKSNIGETATKYAQGGIAAVMYNPDSYEKHIKDTLEAGAGLCDKETVRFTISEAPERIKELVDWGAVFDKNIAGKFDLAREGGHSEFRVLHYKDKTGYEIQRALTEKVKSHKNIEILEDYYSVDFITPHHSGEEVDRSKEGIKCYGAYFICPKDGKIISVLSKITMVCSGGAGNVYNVTTNPDIITGDGIAMAYRAKARVENMEFFQFHPTSLYNPKEKKAFLITEAIRGFGAVLKDKNNNEFMHKYHKLKSLAPRDIVARAIDNEMKMSGDDCVYLDCTHLDSEELKSHFPTIYEHCMGINIDITKDFIPVVPAAHYCCGGIKVDSESKTTIENLFASGECSCTGLHGANRLASNSLLEALVFSNRAALKSIQIVDDIEINYDVPNWNSEGTKLNEEMILITQSLKEVQTIMSSYVGIVRSNLRLKRAFDRLTILYKETEDLYNKSTLTPELCELRNIIVIAYLIIKMATNRKENIGLHYSLDYI